MDSLKSVPQDLELDESLTESEESDQDEELDGYLIMLASDDEEEENFCEDTLLVDSKVVEHSGKVDQEPRFGDLIQRLQDSSLLDNTQKNTIESLIKEFEDVFGTDYSHLTQTNLVEFHVDTGDSKPIYQRPYSKLFMLNWNT